MLNRWQKFVNSRAYMNIQPMPGSVQAIKKLVKQPNFFVVTSRVEEIHEQTHKWVTKHFGTSFKNILFTNQYGNTSKPKTTKSKLCKKLGIQLIIEDHAEFAVDYASHDIEVLLLEQPWNRKKIFPKKSKE